MLGIATALFTGWVHADSLSSPGGGVIEQKHDITMTMSPRFAELVVTRTVLNEGADDTEARFEIDLPPGAVATALRTRGARTARWFDAELHPAELAASHYQAFDGTGPTVPRDPALLEWDSSKRLVLRLFPCAPDKAKSVSYTFLIPTTYRGGKHHVVLPVTGSDDVAATVRVRSTSGSVFADGKRLGANKLITLDDEVDFALEPKRQDTLESEVASVEIDEDTTLAHVAVSAAAKLSTVPRGAHVAIVIDDSRSMSVAAATAQLAVARSYLSHMPDVRVKIVSFNRHVTVHHDRFVKAKRANSDLAAFSFTRQNGSDVRAALLAAEGALASAPAQRPKRILLLTDGWVGTHIPAKQIQASLGTSGAITHVAIVSGDSNAQLSVSRHHAWSDAVRSTGGLAWTLRSPTVADDALAAAVLPLVRPVALRRVVVGVPHSSVSNADMGLDEIREGEGFSNVWLQSEGFPHVKIDAELWAKPISRIVQPHKAAGDRWSALAIAHPVRQEMDHEQVKVLAMRGRAVSPATSYVAIAPGVRPSPEGFGARGIGLGSIGTMSGCGGVQLSTPREDLQKLVTEALANAWSPCGAPGEVSVAIETTGNEVVRVSNIDPAVDVEDTVMECLEARAWGVALPPAFTEPFASFRVTVNDG